ncbi:MAG: hypothetical protein VKJ06_08740 [Vampirovibrionales bacterium]|nr:hypothetical protein [Vampirovibrionales bacterium]
MTARRFFISTGDPSGDWHGAEVARALRQLDPNVQLAGVCGPAMAAAGVHSVLPVQTLQAITGKVGLDALGAVYGHFKLALEVLSYLRRFKPNRVLLIDYGGFHTFLGKLLRQRGYAVDYYILPQIWATRPWRIKNLVKAVDHAYCIFPFEPPLYAAKGISASFVGHPLKGQLPPPVDRRDFCLAHALHPEHPILAILPGSRRSEIVRLLPAMMQSVVLLQQKAAEHGMTLQPVLSRAPNLPVAWFNQQLAQIPAVSQIRLTRLDALDTRLQTDVQAAEQHRAKASTDSAQTQTLASTHALLSVADAALVASGTASLEAALYQTPQVLGYKLDPITARIALWLNRLPGIGLPNIIASPAIMADWPKRANPVRWQPVVPELLQQEFTPEKIALALWPLLQKESSARKLQLQGYQRLSIALGITDSAENAAQSAAQKVASGVMRASLAQ